MREMPCVSGIGRLTARPSTMGDGPPPELLSNPFLLNTIRMLGQSLIGDFACLHLKPYAMGRCI